MKRNRATLKCVSFALIAVTLLLLLAGCAGKRDAMKTENYTFDEGMLKYFYYEAYNGIYAMYESSYGEEVSDYISEIKSNAYTTATTEAEMVLVLCEAARAANVELEDDEIKAIEERISQIEKNAKDANVSISEYFGNVGVDVSDIRNANKLLSLAGKYESVKLESLYGELPGDDELKEYYSSKLGTDGITIGESLTRNVGIILADNRETAESILAEFENTEMTSEDFEKLADNAAEEVVSNGAGMYQNIRRAQLIEELNDWLYDESRKVGDTGIVESDNGFCVMFYAEDGEPTWKLDAAEQYVSEKFDEWYASLTYSVGKNKGVFDDLKK